MAITLRRLRAMCCALEAGTHPLPAELLPQQLFSELRADLAEHFAAEESQEYFGTVIEEEPSLAPQIGALKWEHLGMLSGVERLQLAAKDERHWSALSTPTRDLVAQLERH